MDAQTLKKQLGFRLFPSKLDINLDENKDILYIGIEASSVCDNMQQDSSAFEGWIFCIYAPMQDKIKQVELSWLIPDEKDQNTHYNRFLYRVIKMQQHFNWFSVASDNHQELAAFRNRYKDVKLVLNQPRVAGKQTDLKEKTEAFLERAFMDEKQFYKGIQFDSFNHQLPVGLFMDSISQNSSIFPGNKGAIDLWGIRKDEFWIFELKFNNSKVGILSEILFYLWIMEDLFFTRKIAYDPSGKSNTIRALNRVYDLAQAGISKLHGVLLTDKLHPYIDNRVIDFINKTNQESRILLSVQMYKPRITVKLL